MQFSFAKDTMLLLYKVTKDCLLACLFFKMELIGIKLNPFIKSSFKQIKKMRGFIKLTVILSLIDSTFNLIVDKMMVIREKHMVKQTNRILSHHLTHPNFLSLYSLLSN